MGLYQQYFFLSPPGPPSDLQRMSTGCAVVVQSWTEAMCFGFITWDVVRFSWYLSARWHWEEHIYIQARLLTLKKALSKWYVETNVDRIRNSISNIRRHFSLIKLSSSNYFGRSSKTLDWAGFGGKFVASEKSNLMFQITLTMLTGLIKCVIIN